MDCYRNAFRHPHHRIHGRPNGFLLNGKRVQLNGVCDHSDLGALGTAINTRALERQIEILKEMGCNAIRTSHNPPAPELLDLCDRMGMLVMDESFDCWESRQDAERLSSAVRRLARARLARGIAPRPQSSLLILVEHRQRSRRPGQPVEILDCRRTDRHRAQEDPTRPTTSATATRKPVSTVSRPTRTCLATTTSRSIMAGSTRPIPTSRSSAARPPPASARAANTFSPSPRTRATA